MNEVIRKKTTLEGEIKPDQDIEDAVLVEENKSPESAEAVVVKESVEAESDKLPNIDEFKTLEEIDNAFVLAKDEFFNLAGEETNETIESGKSILVLFDRVSKNDENVEKNIKLKYLKGLRLCVEELKSSNSNNSESELILEESPVELTETEKTADSEDSENEEYQIAREEWKKTKEAHREKKQKYDEALSEFYGSQTKFDKSINSVKKFFGFKPELPLDLSVLETEYKTERNKYAIGLNSALNKRGNLNGNKERLEKYNENAEEEKVNIYDEKSDSFKIAFADKFILKPNQELLAKQENNLLSENQKETLARISQKLGKHKWHIRGGMVVMAGFVGSVTGAGLAVGAGWQAWKILAGTAMGAGAGVITNKAMQGRVDRAESDIEKQTLKFDVNTLDALEQDLLDAVGTRDRNLRQQKVASIAAAVIAGGATSYNLAGIDASEAAATVSENTAPVVEAFSNEIEKVVAENPVLQHLVGDEVVDASNINEIGRTISVDTDPLVTTEAIASSFEMPIAKNMSIPDYSFDGSVNFQTVITDLKIDSQGNLAENLTTTQKNALEQYIKLTAIDQLSAHPNISQANLEAGILTKLENKFGADEWWKNAQVKGVEIGSLEKVSVGDVSADIVPKTESVTDSIENSRIIEVEKGDNLWNIIKAQYSMELNGLSTVEQNQVIDKLLDKVNSHPELMKAMNPQMEDVDVIYPDQKIDIGVLEEELKKLVELEKRDVDNVAYTKSSTIPVEIGNSEVNKVKINFTTNPDIGFDAPPVISHSADILEKPITPISPLEALKIEEVKFNVDSPTPSRIEMLNTGNYLKTPEYQNYILQVFGNEKDFNTVLNNEVENVDKFTYDWFNRGAHKSFYEVYGALPLSEFGHFQQLDRGQIITLLNEKGIKYEAYLAWQDKINNITNTNIPHTPKTTIADLFSRFVVESKAMQLRK